MTMTIAFSKAACVMMSRGLMSFFISSSRYLQGRQAARGGDSRGASQSV